MSHPTPSLPVASAPAGAPFDPAALARLANELFQASPGASASPALGAAG
ncbi:hypothetical protein GTP69_12755, partial [Duganella sp. CY42W]|nr:hypothetical protein [Duganella levis]